MSIELDQNVYNPLVQEHTHMSNSVSDKPTMNIDNSASDSDSSKTKKKKDKKLKKQNSNLSVNKIMLDEDGSNRHTFSAFTSSTTSLPERNGRHSFSSSSRSSIASAKQTPITKVNSSSNLSINSIVTMDDNKELPVFEVLLNSRSSNESQAFLEFLRLSRSHESLLFYWEVQDFIQLHRSRADKSIIETKAEGIIDKYIAGRSKLEMNLPAPVKKEIMEEISKDHITSSLFVKAQAVATKTLKFDGFARFLREEYNAGK
eukprot:Awhi_evm1s2606